MSKINQMPNRDDSMYWREAVVLHGHKKKSMKSVLQELVRTCYSNILPDLSNWIKSELL